MLDCYENKLPDAQPLKRETREKSEMRKYQLFLGPSRTAYLSGKMLLPIRVFPLNSKFLPFRLSNVVWSGENGGFENRIPPHTDGRLIGNNLRVSLTSKFEVQIHARLW